MANSLVRVRRDDGVTLAVASRGDPQAPCLVFAHGFGQTRQAWRKSAEALAAAGFHCLSYDARGHGASDHAAPDRYRVQDFAEDLAAVAALAAAPPVLIGASMGGLVGLGLAGEREPSPFSALVLVDITPRWEAAGIERILAFMRARPDGFANHAEVAAAIAAYLPHRQGQRSAAQLDSLLRQGDDGRLHWHWDPAMLDSVVAEGDIHQPRLLAAARRVRQPVLLLSGGRSDVVSPATVSEFLELVPHARHVELPQATHMVAGDSNDGFIREIIRFLAATHPESEP
ncbi:MAG TPA: alpha/beta fold hydrolase [Rhodanobacteraceae bacterium]|nr:alpha/beta fold hydrolase [Rhodanobacteraceae bacterium]